MNLPSLTVSEVNSYIKNMFDIELLMQSIIISGEISNFSRHYASGHMYFSLKDEKSAIKAVIFSRNASKLRFIPENGMKVFALGRIGVFERDGIYQLYCDDLQPDGAGALAVAFEQLKKKLDAKGLFDSSHKKKIPEFPKRIGVITSPTGAAIQDILSILSRRFPLAEVIFKGVSVQGINAAPEMVQALYEFTDKNCADVIIIGRGGGSAEDLWVFNDENLAYAVYSCPIPVISAVGHETDFTICDFVADLRAPTPSAAAELAVPDINSLFMNTNALIQRLHDSMHMLIEDEKKKFSFILAAHPFTDAGHFFDSEKFKLQNIDVTLHAVMNKIISQEREKFSVCIAGLEKLNPLSVLLRGYSIVRYENKILGSVHGIKTGQELEIDMSDGIVSCCVTDVKRSESNG